MNSPEHLKGEACMYGIDLQDLERIIGCMQDGKEIALKVIVKKESDKKDFHEILGILDKGPRFKTKINHMYLKLHTGEVKEISYYDLKRIDVLSMSDLLKMLGKITG